MSVVQCVSQPQEKITVREVQLDLAPSVRSSDVEVTLHHDRVKVEGPSSVIPRRLVVDPNAIDIGESLCAADLPLPETCEVIGLWFAAPLVSVASASA